MTPKPVTIKTLASQIGVTPATVSKALRDASDISEKTKTKIKKLAKELGYKPNLMARNLVSKKSNIIGIVVPDISTSFFGFAVRGINLNAREYSLETIVLVNNEDYKIERKNLEFLYNLQVDGIIMDAVPGNKNIDLLSELTAKGIPIVFIDRKCKKIKADSVTTNDVKAGYVMTKYFLSRKKKNIAFIGPTDKLSVAYDRLTGYKKALNESKIAFNDKLIIPIDYAIKKEKLVEKIKTFIHSGVKFDSLICTGGLIAYLAGATLLKSGIDISQNIFIGEFGDNNIVYRLGIPFVTVDQQPFNIGEKALSILVNRINSKGKIFRKKHLYINSKLIYINPYEQKRIIIADI